MANMNHTILPATGQSLDALDSPQLLLDLDVVDANGSRMLDAFRERPVNVRVHFKSLKCAGLARYLASRGVRNFLCAKLNEAEVLADAGLVDLFVANQIVGPLKLRRLAELARRAQVRVCVDDAGNVDEMSRAAQAAGSSIGVPLRRCARATGSSAGAAHRHPHRLALHWPARVRWPFADAARRQGAADQVSGRIAQPGGNTQTP
jgi:D-serine deaminase-like pyridoxal phosphate-dependent protein